ncbi:hypothetical protein D9758_012282 [Tetrapyrgos nigripes]|uniref:Uncharacterized protein n=1 Tax=Tetrapyrgos nigripes TaxID=182062 RepID=A0A8H5CHY0_9AGAR|nr:hypothetical protein D9758_012282 [Tetrapyrgos nigripes]
MTSLETSMLPAEVWGRIAFYAVASEETFLGPPSAISSLLLTCRWLYQSLNFRSNPGFYARVFRFKFDYDAPLRRLGMEWLTTRCLAVELKKRMEVLKRVRRREEYSSQDLWTCYLMMSENDGRNERQLVEWARLYPYLQRAASMRFESDPNSSASWYSGSECTALILWLWWMIFSREDLRIENSHIQNTLVRHLLHRFIVTGFRYPSWYGAESQFHLPLLPESDNQAWSTSPLPETTKIIHYSFPVTIASPLLNYGSLLTWIARMETFLERQTPVVGALGDLPATREEANAQNLTGPTQEDILRSHRNQVYTPERCTTTIHVMYDDDENFCSSEHDIARRGSRRYDEDWYRMVSCCDPCSTKSTLRGAVYRPGSLTGSWAGTYLQTSQNVHMELISNPRRSVDAVTIFRQPLYFSLQEHHCLHPDEPIDIGFDEFGDDNLLNAWLPNDFRIDTLKDAIEIYNPRTKRSVRYETFSPEGTAAGTMCYSKAACEKLKRDWIYDEETNEEELSDTSVDGDLSTFRSLSSDQSQGLGRDEYTATVSHLDSGIADILVTGETGEEHGSAWGHFNIVGRVRPWDGLVVLLRTPRDQQNAHLGKWIFRGYLHDRNLVGRWRETSTAAKYVGYDGPFVVKKLPQQ